MVQLLSPYIFGPTMFVNLTAAIDVPHNAKHWCIMAVSTFQPLLFIKNRVDVALNLQGLSDLTTCVVRLAVFLMLVRASFMDLDQIDIFS